MSNGDCKAVVGSPDVLFTGVLFFFFTQYNLFFPISICGGCRNMCCQDFSKKKNINLFQTVCVCVCVPNLIKLRGDVHALTPHLCAAFSRMSVLAG